MIESKGAQKMGDEGEGREGGEVERDSDREADRKTEIDYFQGIG